MPVANTMAAVVAAALTNDVAILLKQMAGSKLFNIMAAGYSRRLASLSWRLFAN